MASHFYPSGSGIIFPTEQPITGVFKDYQYILPCHLPNHDLAKSHSFNLSLHQRVESKPPSGLLESNHFITIDSTDKMSELVDVKDANPNTILFSSGIAEQCIRQEKIMKLLVSGPSEIESNSLDLSTLFDSRGPQPPITDLPQQTFASYSKWCFIDDESQQSLVYPIREFYLKEPLLDLVGDLSWFSEITCDPSGQLLFHGTGIEMNDVLSIIADYYLSKNPVKSSKQTMLVPYFESRRRRASANTKRGKLEGVKGVMVNSPDKVKDKTSQKKKTNRKTRKERESNRYLHACESLLSIMVNRKQPGRSAILSLKKSGPKLPQLLTQVSASVAGTGIAVLFCVICKITCARAPFCWSKVLSTGLGLGLVWLSWAVNKLRDTVTMITKNSGKLAIKEEEVMNTLDRSMKDVYFRAAALLAVAVLRLA